MVVLTFVKNGILIVTFCFILLLIGKASTMTKLYTLFLSFLFLAACKSPGKAFDKGDYTAAIERSVRKLQKDPRDAEAKRILQSAYTYAVQQHEEKIRNLSGLHSDNRWEQVYYQYVQLQKLHDKIYEAPAAVQAVRPVNYTSYLATYRDKSAEAHVQKAARLLEENDDRTAYREAYYELRKALKFRPEDHGILKKLEEAKEAATVTVLLVPMDAVGNTRYNTSYAFRNFERELVRTVRNGINNEFLQFTTLAENRNSDRNGPDEVIEMRLGAFNIGRPYDESKTRTVEKEVVVKEIVYSKDSVVKEYAKVQARITTTKRLLRSTSDMYLNILDGERRVLWNDQVRAEHRWTTEFATFTGDERALSDNDKALVNKSQKTPPRDEEIEESLLDRLASEVTQRLRSYYSRY
jgi:hypothetical protein